MPGGTPVRRERNQSIRNMCDFQFTRITRQYGAIVSVTDDYFLAIVSPRSLYQMADDTDPSCQSLQVADRGANTGGGMAHSP
jgi:hypothetical protein